MRWKVGIAGPANDLAELSRSLCTEDLFIEKNEHGQHYLCCVKFESCNSADEVSEACEPILALLYGAIKLAHGFTPSLATTGVLEERADGSKVMHLRFEDSISVRDSFDVSVMDDEGNVVAEHKETDPVQAWVTVGLRDESVGKVFRLLAQPQSWVGLYRIFEVIESDAGGIDSIAAQGWVTKSVIKTFKHTANSPGAVGDDARHGKETTAPPQNPMLLSEARLFIETLVHGWLRSKNLI